MDTLIPTSLMNYINRDFSRSKAITCPPILNPGLKWGRFTSATVFSWDVNSAVRMVNQVFDGWGRIFFRDLHSQGQHDNEF